MEESRPSLDPPAPERDHCRGDEGVRGRPHVARQREIEIDAEHATTARERLAELGYEAVSIRVGDGREGWSDHAPYDKVYLTCAVRAFPPALVEQTRPGGLLLAPIGLADQRLVLATKRKDGTLDRLDCGPVQFVPMQGTSE